VIGTLPAECLLAMTGLFPSRGPSDTQKRLAQRFPKRLVNRVKDFLESDKIAKFKPPEQKDQTSLHEKLLTKVDPDEIGDAFLPEEATLSAQYVLLMQSARDKVAASWPLYPDSSFGIHNFDLAPDELLNVLQVLQTLDSVESLFDDLDARVLLPDQVTLFSQVYPDLYEVLKNAAMDEIAPYLEIQGAVTAKRRLSQLHEEQMRILLQLPADAPIETQEQQPTQQGQPGQRPGRRQIDKDTDGEGSSMETPLEHTAAHRVAK